MNEPSGKLKFAYETIAKMELKIKELSKIPEKQVILEVHKMSASSLDPENFNNIEKALRQLVSNRNIEVVI